MLLIPLFLSFLPLFSLINSLPINNAVRHRIMKRFVLHNQRWERCRLTWAFRDPFRLFASDDQFNMAKSVVANAMLHWQRAGNHLLRLTDLSPASRSSLLNSRRVADIDIFFAGFAHGDAESFDGRGGLVAHSAYPPLGIVHFDASERWILDKKRRENDVEGGERGQETTLDLGYVALHEIGHALGLRHSLFRNSVMNRYYKEQLMDTRGDGQRIFQLSKDDKAAIDELFGEKCQLPYFL